MITRTILAVGNRGQLARKLVEVGDRLGLPIACVGRPTLDIARPDAIAKAMDALEPSVVINAAAFTNVDLAETERELARAVNHAGAAMLAQCCRRRQVPLVQISTDYVFDGTKQGLYNEQDRANPLNYYGVTKYAGEQDVLATHERALVVRTSRVFSEHGGNFLGRVMERVAAGSQLRVVADEYGCPTYAGDLAEALIQIVYQLGRGWSTRYNTVFHAAGASSCSWYEFADYALRSLPANQRQHIEVRPTSASEWKAAATRPENSRLDCGRLKETFKIELPSWKTSIESIVPKAFSRAIEVVSDQGKDKA